MKIDKLTSMPGVLAVLVFCFSSDRVEASRPDPEHAVTIDMLMRVRALFRATPEHELEVVVGRGPGSIRYIVRQLGDRVVVVAHVHGHECAKSLNRSILRACKSSAPCGAEGGPGAPVPVVDVTEPGPGAAGAAPARASLEDELANAFASPANDTREP